MKNPAVQPLARVVALLVVALLVVALSGRALPAQSSREPIDFDRDIRPLLADRCYQCHGPDDHARQADLRLDTAAGATADRGGYAAVVPGRPEESEVVARLTAEDAVDRMPPAAAKLGFTADETALVRRWIAEGATYDEHWAFAAPRALEPPAVTRTNWPRDDIDRFVLQRLERAGLEPAPEADRESLIRRTAFVLTGLAPPQPLVDAFVADRSDGAWEKVVDALLASPRYGERMASVWLDLARYADTYGYQSDVTRPVWRWRDWVIDAFNRNLPYDDFLTWQLAGDLLPDATREQRLATAFNRLHRQTNEGGSVEEEYRVEYVADRTQTAGTVFLGLTLECARCHDHKFDPISQREYYRLTAFFDDIDESGLYSHFTGATPTPALALPTSQQSTELATLRAEITDAETELATLRRTRREVFDRDPERALIPPLADLHGRFALDEIGEDGRLANTADPEKPGRVADGPTPVGGARGGALLLSGENNVSFPGVGEFTRATPFTIALRLRVPRAFDRAVVFHRSRAWTDAASQGYQLLIEDGFLSASLIHFWPGNAISIRSAEPIPVDRWVHVAMSYDGSMRADGLALWIDGCRAACTVVKDELTKGITGGGDLVLTLGQRFRDRGLAGGAVDDVAVVARALTAGEIAALHDAEAEALDDDAAYARWSGAVDPVCRAKQADLTAARQRLARVLDDVEEIMTMRALAEPRRTHVLARGRYDAPGEEVGADVPAILPPFPDDAPRDRLGLARWATAPGHPLTSRVAANLLWRVVFGRGLVATPENFGTQGLRATHPALLDHLALALVASGWDVKAMLRRMVLSATWRQGTRATPAKRERDPENALWSRAPARRLAAEMLRDHALAASGLLVETVGGPSVKPWQPPGLWREKNAGLLYVPDQGDGLHRRSLYTFWKRTAPPPGMMIFDAAKRDVCTARRSETNTPLQALALMNDRQFLETSLALARRVLRDSGEDVAGARAAAFRELTGRRPRLGEEAALTDLWDAAELELREHPDRATELTSVGEAALEEEADRARLAAMMLVCSTILGADATVTIR